jgi:formate dehydrogenase subunit beta
MVTDLLRHMLTGGGIGAVLTLRRDPETSAYDYGLISDPGGLEHAVPLDPVMPVNGGEVLTEVTPSKETIAAVLKPCEVRAFIERVKREQGSMDNVLIISHVCGGAFPLKMAANRTIDARLEGYFDSLSKMEMPEGIRPTCSACEHFIPENADIIVSPAGTGAVHVISDKAREAVKRFSGKTVDAGFDASSVSGILDRRLASKEEMYSSLMDGRGGLDALVDTFGKCVGCHGCGHVCPICYCVMCDFESRNFDYDMPYFEKELEQKKALRLPPDTMFFHMGRLSHMSFSCVGCGLCSDVCPASIPVSQVFKKTGEQTAGLFEYVAGRDVEEPIPVMVFKEEEFLELGED